MQTIKENCYKGTRILVGNEKRRLLDSMAACLLGLGFTEISLPVLQMQSTFAGKVGSENSNLMFNFQDRGGRDICLAPEYTAVVQQLAQTTYASLRDVRLFYVQECFRGEKPQQGRYRQFTQLGVEVLNPLVETLAGLVKIAREMVLLRTERFVETTGVARGLDYYTEGKGFEIACPELGAQQQICGGGEYEGGIGFAIGIDRLLLTAPTAA